jgi:nitrogen fixation protein NifX
MKIALATTDGAMIDEHFGRAGKFAVYDLTPEGYELVETRTFADGIDDAVAGTKGRGQAHDDAVQAKVDRLSDCRIIFLTEIGGPSAARLVKKRIMPMKVRSVTPIAEELDRLLATVRSAPPPWLRKAMNS